VNAYKDLADSLPMAQVLTELWFLNPGMVSPAGRMDPMFQSRFLKTFLAERMHNTILELLKGRFGTVQLSQDALSRLRDVLDEEKLIDLAALAGLCNDLQAFQEGLLSRTKRRTARGRRP
jgi:hypothetical protein